MTLTAIITDVRYRMSLALIRDLAEAGVTVVACENDDATPPLGFYSKYVTASTFFRSENYLEELYALCAKITADEGEKPALLPVGAKTLALLAEDDVKKKFAAVCGLAVAETATLSLFNDKEQSNLLARRLHIPVPETYRRQKETKDAFLASLPLPAVVKPLCGEKLGLTAKDRYCIAKDRTALAKAYDHFAALGEEPIVQQYLPGGGLGCSVFAEDGVIRSVLCHRRLREYPVSGGPSACCSSFASPLLTDYAARFIAAVKFTGVAMFEFKEDSQGAPRFLEINPRIWGSFPLTRISHSDLSLRWYESAWQNGNPGRTVTLATPVYHDAVMRFAVSDLMSAKGYLRQGDKKRAAAALAAQFRPGIKDGLWEWRDPKPGWVYYRSLLTKRRKRNDHH